MHRLITLLMLLCATASMAQRQNVSGSVSGPDGPVAGVSVREIDTDHRIFNHTKADENGLFSFRVRNAQHALQFYAPGYRTFTHKMLGAKSFKVTMEKRRTSPFVATAKVIMKSEHLFCGHYLGQVVPLQAWIEQMNDTLFALILPVEMERPVDEYPAGRQLIVLDEMGRSVMELENVIDAYPIAGDPDEMNDQRLAQSYKGDNYIPGGADDEARLFAYPHFQVTRAQLERLCQKPSLLARLAVSTFRADNYWNFFPTGQTIELIRKTLDR